MRRRNRWLAMGLLLAGLITAGCTAKAASTNVQAPPAKVVPIEGTDLNRVELTSEAVERVGVMTEPVRAVPAAGSSVGARTQAMIPLAAVLYDKDGLTWAYTNPEPMVFVRQRLVISRVTGDLAVLQSGPSPGIAVVTVGAAELLGAEYGVEGE
jgi:hypothetical protein